MAAACQRKARRGSGGSESARGRSGGVPARGHGGVRARRQRARARARRARGGGVPARGHGGVRARRQRARARWSNALEVRLKEKLTYGPHTLVREGREVAGIFWTIRKYTGLRVGPRASKTYKMTRFKEEKNCNGTIQNT